MKKILLILAVIMATSVSAQKQDVKIKNLTATPAFRFGEPEIRVEWDAKNSIYSQHKVKHPNFNQWAKTNANEGKWTTYGLQFKKSTLSDVTYQIKVTGENGKVAKRKIRISKILAIRNGIGRTANNEVYISLAAKGDWKDVVGRTVYIGKDNAVGDIVTADFFGFGSLMHISLDVEHSEAELVEAIREEKDAYIWFKQRN